MRLLDLFCGAGGAAVGYHRAGFDEVVGVDVVRQPDYPFTFVQADALSPPMCLDDFDLIHASPPCQSFTAMGNRWKNPRWPDMVSPIRELLGQRRYVIENVSGAVRSLHNPVELTGEMFGLTVHRPRLFELGGWYGLMPAKQPRQPNPVAVYGKPDGRRLWDRKDGTMLRAWTLEQGREAMGMPWATEELGIREAVPPAYTEYLGRLFLGT